jgi:hypothetical protein
VPADNCRAPPPGAPPTLLAALLVAWLVAVGSLLTATPASAHPFGEPQTARISADGSQVIMRWTSPPDDLLLLGGAVGAIPGLRTYVFDSSPDGVPEQVGASDRELITSSPDVAAYMADHLAVRQGGQACEPDVSLDDLMDDGALIVFECDRAVTDVEIEITMLTDFHESYRTAAIGAGGMTPGRVLYTVDDPVHRWSFEPGDRGSSGTGAVPWVAAGMLVTLLGLGTWAWRRVGAGAS